MSLNNRIKPPGLSAINKSKRRLFTRQVIAATFGCATLLQWRSASGATVMAVRIWPSRDYTRVTIELDRELKFTQNYLRNPERLFVDLENLDIDPQIKDIVAKVAPNDPYIASVRVAQYASKVVRLVFDLKSAVKPKLFALAPVGPYQHRLVFDLYPVLEVDPLTVLIDRQGQRPALAPNSVPASPPTASLPPASPPVTMSTKPPVTAGAPTGPDAIESLLKGGTAKSDPVKPSAQQNTPANASVVTGVTPAAGSPPVSGAAKSDRPAAAEKPIVERMVTIAIDPGHGGEDPGATGKGGTLEKDVVLAISQKLRDRIESEPNMRAYLTRDADYFVELASRVQRARRVKADLFVSIHADAFINPQARGASVFALSERGASSTAARWMAKKENAADQIGGVPLSSTRGVAQVLLSLSTEAQIRMSTGLAKTVLKELGSVGNLHKAQVEQANFAVLRSPDIPSILVETAFISNPQEEARLSDERYQAKIANAIFNGIKAWVRRNPPAPKGGAV